MKFWLSKNSAVPLREQLATQIMLGIVSCDLQPGQKLPSTREMARRFQIHLNTVSAAYRDLAARGWVEFRKGSGIYVRPLPLDEENAAESALHTEHELDKLVSDLLQAARARGFTPDEITARLARRLNAPLPDHFLIVEPDAELRRILIAEISEACEFPVRGARPEDCAKTKDLTRSMPVAMYRQAQAARNALPAGMSCELIRARSVSETLRGEEVPPPPDALIAVVSRWPEFLRWSRTILIAAGIDAAALSFHDARTKNWRRGLRASAFVITDAVTAAELPAGCTARVFRIISDASLAQLRTLSNEF